MGGGAPGIFEVADKLGLKVAAGEFPRSVLVFGDALAGTDEHDDDGNEDDGDEEGGSCDWEDGEENGQLEFGFGSAAPAILMDDLESESEIFFAPPPLPLPPGGEPALLKPSCEILAPPPAREPGLPAPAPETDLPFPIPIPNAEEARTNPP